MLVPKAMLLTLGALTVGAAAVGAVMAPGNASAPGTRPPPTPVVSPPTTATAPPPTTVVSPTPPGPPNPPAPGPLFVNARAWAGHGDLAFVSRGQLEVVNDSGAVAAVTGPPTGGFDSDPSWSADGVWLAFLHTGPSQGFAVPAATLWLLARGSTTARPVGTEPVATYAWSPTATVLAYVTTSQSAATSPSAEPEDIDFDVPGATPAAVTVGNGSGVQAIAWSFDGTQLAFSDLADAQAATATSPATPPQSRIGVIPAGGGTVDVAYTDHTDCLDLAGWWPEGGGLLFWADPGCSSSIAADGVSLDSLPSGSATPTALATSLVGPQWVAAQPGGDAVAVVAGGGRSVWSSDRDVTVCTFPAATCQVPSAPDGFETLAPAWTSSGSLLFARASTSTPFGTQGSADWTEGYMAEWNATNTMWGRSRSGAIGQLAGAPAGALLASPAQAGSAVLYVADDALWLGDPTSATEAVEVAGPLYSDAAPSGYYGEVDWSGTFAWAQAPLPQLLSTRLIDESLAATGAGGPTP